jgi:hypothetical protein
MLLAACQGQPADRPEAKGAEPVAAASPSAIAPSPAAEPRSVACAARETPIFSCTSKDKKRVAVCGTKVGTAEYRVRGDTPELELDGGQYGYTMYSGGGEGQIAFDNGDTRYIVFSRMVRTSWDDEGHNILAMSDGVVVERGGKFLDIKLCDDPDFLPIQNDAANAVWEDAGETFTEETIRADPTGNE